MEEASLIVTVQRARRFRKQLTPQEAVLWVHLRALRQRGFHIRRQAPFRGYILDFVCFDRRLAIELDGQHHGMDEAFRHDTVRDEVLAREGFLTLRFQNTEITQNLNGVVERIVATLETLPPTRPLRGHPPHKGEG